MLAMPYATVVDPAPTGRNLFHRPRRRNPAPIQIDRCRQRTCRDRSALMNRRHASRLGQTCRLQCAGGSEEVQHSVDPDLGDAVARGLGGTNVYLVGMMGCGKTTVGSALAKKLKKYAFMDLDHLIELSAKCSIQEIFEKYGEEEFRSLETSVLQDLHQYKDLVVGTGGGVVLRQMNWSYLYQGVVVFLNGPLEKLALRVAKDGLRGRPLLTQSTEEENDDPVQVALKKLQTVYSQRETLYKSADIEIPLADPMSETGLASVDVVVARILSRLHERLEEGKKLRRSKRSYEISGAAELPDGRPTINAPTPTDEPTSFGETL